MPQFPFRDKCLLGHRCCLWCKFPPGDMAVTSLPHPISATTPCPPHHGDSRVLGCFKVICKVGPGGCRVDAVTPTLFCGVIPMGLEQFPAGINPVVRERIAGAGLPWAGWGMSHLLSFSSASKRSFLVGKKKVSSWHF